MEGKFAAVYEAIVGIWMLVCLVVLIWGFTQIS